MTSSAQRTWKSSDLRAGSQSGRQPQSSQTSEFRADRTEDRVSDHGTRTGNTQTRITNHMKQMTWERNDQISVWYIYT